MIGITQRAKEALLLLKLSVPIDDPEVGIRLASGEGVAPSVEEGVGPTAPTAEGGHIMRSERTAEIPAHEVAEGLCQERRPRCPQFRQVGMESPYPVQGYCVLGQSTGWFLIPSIAEYRGYCTTSQFGACRWFGGTGERFGSVEGQRGEQPTRMDTWNPPDVAHPLLRDHL